MSAPPVIAIARVYESEIPHSGVRLLVDRLWPRGISKASLHLEDWIPEVAPSTALRKWFGHDPQKWHEFQLRYRAELREAGEPVDRCLAWVRKGPVLLLYGAKDNAHNNAIVLREYLLQHADKKSLSS